MAPEFARGEAPVRKVALLPVDLSLQVAGRSVRSPELERAIQALSHRAVSELVLALRRRGYEVNAVLRPDGVALALPGGKLEAVLHPQDLLALRVQLHEQTAHAPPGPGPLEAETSPELTIPLKAVLGADATLYARGWAYVAPRQSGWITALQIVGITLLVAVAVVLIAAAIAGKGKGLSGLGKLFSGIGRGAAHVAVALGRITVRALPELVRLGAIATHAGSRPCLSCVPPPDWRDPWDRSPPRESGARQLPHPVPLTLDLRGRGPAPTSSAAGVAISLVHNETGRVLWHAGQTFEVTLTGEGKLERLIEHFLKQLPLAPGPLPGPLPGPARLRAPR